MFFAVMLMVRNIDNKREQQPIVAPDSSDREEPIRAQQEN
jgi:hypothetical protein